MFSREYCKTFKNNFFYRTPLVIDFVILKPVNWFAISNHLTGFYMMRTLFINELT